MDEEAGTDGSRPEKRQWVVVIDVAIIGRRKIVAIEWAVTASTVSQQALADFLSHFGNISTDGIAWRRSYGR